MRTSERPPLGKPEAAAVHKTIEEAANVGARGRESGPSRRGRRHRLLARNPATEGQGEGSA
jgi:hypothetical protein